MTERKSCALRISVHIRVDLSRREESIETELIEGNGSPLLTLIETRKLVRVIDVTLGYAK